jgi:DNA-binding NarL/FixJ family response regulator
MPQPTVVFIDDDVMFAGFFVERMAPRLARLGYAVLPLVTAVEQVGQAPHPGSVAVCDVALHAGREGDAAVRYLAARYWSVLLVSGQAPDEQVLEAIAAGARGYLVKKDSPETVIEAITAISAGGVHLSEGLADLFYKDLYLRRPPAAPELKPVDREVLAWYVQGRVGKPPEAVRLRPADEQAAIDRIFAAAVARRTMFRLTEAERQVVRMVGCFGASAEQAASGLYLSRNTVNTHLRRIREKYLACHPHVKDVPQRVAAQSWAKELNLCHQETD